MSMGDSITVGVDYETASAGGYRDPLYRDLTAAGLPFTFVGINSSQATATLTNAGEQLHCGFGGWHIGDLDANLNGVAAPVNGGDSNNGGYILTGGNGTGRGALTPNILLLHVGTNDLLTGTPNINQALYSLVTHIHALSPGTLILVAGVIPINSTGFTPSINAYNAYIKTQLVPSLSYTQYVDQNSGFLNADGSVNGSLLGTDNVHPNRYGYPILAQVWANALQTLKGVTPATHSLSVSGGSGSGSYPAGSVITLIANQPAGNQQFGSWSMPTLALSNPFSSPVVFTMPAANTTVTANYAVQGSPIIPNGNYEIASNYNGLAVTATSATSSSAVQQQTYSNGSTQNWTLTNLGNNLVSLMLPGTNEALEVPAANASTLGAALDVAPYTASANQQWTITPVAGTFDIVNQSSGQVINVSGYSTSAGSPLLQYNSGFVDDWWLFYPASVQATLYPLTVTQGSGGGTYAPGSVVPVNANAAPTGMQFSQWTGGISGLANTSSATTTLTMPVAADTITANYMPVAQTTYALTVNGGTGGGSYAAGAVIKITAGAAPAGAQFAQWTGNTAALSNANASTTTVTMPAAAVSITAAYTQSPQAVAATPTVSVQFVGGGAAPLRGPGYNYTAGAPSYAASNWNPVLNTGNTTAPQTLAVSGTLIDSNGAASALGFQLRASGAYYTGAGSAFPGNPPYPGYASRLSGAGDSFLYGGFAYAGYSDGSPLTLTLLGLNPAHTYTIIAYTAPFQGFGGRQSETVSLGATTYSVLTDGAATTYERAAAAGSAGNYVEFDQVSGASTQTLTLTNTSSLVGLSGFQVVDLGGGAGTPIETLAVTGGSGSGSYAPGTVVTITANAVAGQVFAGWTGATSTLANAQAATTTVTIPSTSVAVTATYAPAPAAPAPAAPAGAASLIVSVQFVGGGAAPLHGSSFDYTAGAYAAGNWNPLLATGNTTTPQTLTVTSGLTDSTGAASQVGVSLAASGAYYTGAGSNFTGAPAYPGYAGRASGPGDSFLYSGFAFAGYSNQSPLTLTVSGLHPGSTYSLVVYVTPFEQFGDNQTATIAVTGGAALKVSPTGSAATYQRAGVSGGSATGNYVQFDGLTGSATQTITFTNTSTLVGVSGLQVVDLGPQ